MGLQVQHSHRASHPPRRHYPRPCHRQIAIAHHQT